MYRAHPHPECKYWCQNHLVLQHVLATFAKVCCTAVHWLNIAAVSWKIFRVHYLFFYLFILLKLMVNH